jgi:hypothetical protein
MNKIDLDNVRIAAPCPASWAEMEGDDRSRFCKDCKLNVYNIAAMEKKEAEAFISEKEGRVCVRLFRRPDGKLITADCPVGKVRKRRRRIGIAAAIALLFGGSARAAASQYDGGASNSSDLRQRVMNFLDRPADRLAHQFNIDSLCSCQEILGEIVCPPPPTPANPANVSPPTEGN